MRSKLLSYFMVATLWLGAQVFTACSTHKEVVYFQDLQKGNSENILNPLMIRVKSGDKISIVVKSKDAQLSDLFNLPIVTYRVGSGKMSSLTNQSQSVSSYSVMSDGTVDFPVLGRIAVAGKTREEIASLVKSKLIEADLVKDPVVTVEFDNLCYAVLGEVNRPGQFSIDRDKVSILEAISKAGDLNIYGKRDNVTVLRQEGDKQTTYRVNLTSGYDLYASPVFYLQQNDVVYVEPNSTRARQSTVNGNNILSTSFWVSVASLLTSIAVLLVK